MLALAWRELLAVVGGKFGACHLPTLITFIILRRIDPFYGTLCNPADY